MWVCDSSKEAKIHTTSTVDYTRWNFSEEMSRYTSCLKEDLASYSSMSCKSLYDSLKGCENTPLLLLFLTTLVRGKTRDYENVELELHEYMSVCSTTAYIFSLLSKDFVHPYAFLYGSFVWKSE